jgi:hypothetical protein
MLSGMVDSSESSSPKNNSSSALSSISEISSVSETFYFTVTVQKILDENLLQNKLHILNTFWSSL